MVAKENGIIIIIPGRCIVFYYSCVKILEPGKITYS
jgi:hypothetical protein